MSVNPQKIDERINARLLFIISFSITALAIYIYKLYSLGNTWQLPHGFTLNAIFINITFLGSGIFCLGLIVYFFYNKKKTIASLLLISSFITILLVQVVKNYLYKNGIHFFLEESEYINDNANTASIFVSAHTAMAFNVATILAFYYNSRRKTFFFFIAAVIVACSRMYFGHHNLFDILAGAFTGLATASLVFYHYQNRFKIVKPKLLKHKFHNPATPFSIE